MAFNTLCGDRQILEDFFRASVDVQKLPGNSNIVKLTNTTAIPYYIQCPGRNKILLDGCSTVLINFGKQAKKLEFEVLNMRVGENEHLVIDLNK